MAKTLTHKILEEHVTAGDLTAGGEIALRIDQTLTQDSTGTMAYLQLEALGIPKVKTKRSVAYIDHNTLQTGMENADDHAYITSVAGKHGVFVSRAGNGICHQVHLERFAVPGETLLGSDSHTPTAGGIGMLAIGAGGLDVAVAMGGGTYHLSCPKVVEVKLTGRLKPGVAAKDVILNVLKRLTVKGGVGKVLEYTGEGVLSLSVPERATITNMGAELGATTSIFPSDENTKAYLSAQGRAKDFVPLSADVGALYDESLTINLSALVPYAACPHSPDVVRPVAELAGLKVDQVCIGSCTNSSYPDMMKVAALLKGKTVAPGVSLTISPGSRQVLQMLAENGALAQMVAAGARILECACGPCIGMGQSPKANAVSLRTFNRNFYARSGTASAQVYLVSCETAVLSALAGIITEPKDKDMPEVDLPRKFLVNDNLIIDPATVPADAEVIRGENIKPFPRGKALEGTLGAPVLIKVEDNITTDHIMPSNAKLLPYRSNIPYLSEHCLAPVDPTFAARAKKAGQGFIVAGTNYGQGSSREHAALVPLYLGVRAVIAKSFARIHKDNLINNGILPLEFADAADYDDVDQGDELVIDNARAQVEADTPVVIKSARAGKTFKATLTVTRRQREMLLAGGLLNSIKGE